MALPGPLSSGFHLPSIQLGHASTGTVVPNQSWVPAGAATNTELVNVYTSPGTQFNALCAGSVTTEDWPLSRAQIDQILSPTGCGSNSFSLSQPIGEHGYFEVEFNQAANFWGCFFNYGNNLSPTNNCGQEIRQAIAHLINKDTFARTNACTADATTGPVCGALDNAPPRGDELVTPQPCTYDTIAAYVESGTACVVGQDLGTWTAGTAYDCGTLNNGLTHTCAIPQTGTGGFNGDCGALGALVAPASCPGPGISGAVTASGTLPWMNGFGTADFCAASQHLIRAFADIGVTVTADPASCVLNGAGHGSANSALQTTLTGHPVNFMVRSSNPRNELGTGLVTSICAVITGAFDFGCTTGSGDASVANACPNQSVTSSFPSSAILCATQGPITSFPGFTTSATGTPTNGANGNSFSTAGAWEMYTAGFLFVFPADGPIYFAYDSVQTSQTTGSPCYAQVLTGAAGDYQYICDAVFDAYAAQLEFGSCTSPTVGTDPSSGQTAPTFDTCQSITSPGIAVGAGAKIINAPLGTSYPVAVTVTSIPGLAFITAPQTLRTGICSAITVQAWVSAGAPFNVPSDTLLSLSTSSAGGAFSFDSTCSGVTTTFNMSAGTNSASFFYKDSVVGSPTITVSATGLTSAAQTENVVATAPAAPSKLVFTTVGQTLTGICSPITVQTQDSTGKPSNVASATTISLSTTSATGAFFSFGCTTVFTSVTMSAGTNSIINLFYKDTTAGSPSITASATGLTSATQVETVGSGTLSVSSSNTAAATVTPASQSVTLPPGGSGSIAPIVTVTFPSTATAGSTSTITVTVTIGAKTYTITMPVSIAASSSNAGLCPLLATCANLNGIVPSLSAVSAGYLAEREHARLVLTLPVFGGIDTFAYLAPPTAGANPWLRIINQVGIGATANFWTWLNAWNAGSQTLNVGFSETPDKLNPLSASTVWDLYIYGNIWDSLFASPTPYFAGAVSDSSNGGLIDWLTNRHQFPVLNAALGYTPPAGTIETLRAFLNPAATFHDGQPLTAFDVAMSYNFLIKDGSFQAGGLLGIVSGITILGPYEFDINLSQEPFSEAGLGGVTIIPGHLWSNCNSVAGWNSFVSSQTFPLIVPIGITGTACSLGGAMDSVHTSVTFDPVSSGLLVGSGPWECQGTSGGNVGKPGIGCTSSGSQSATGNGAYTLTRNGCTIISAAPGITCVNPASPVSLVVPPGTPFTAPAPAVDCTASPAAPAPPNCTTPSGTVQSTYFRSPSTFARYIWTGIAGNSFSNNGFSVVSQLSTCSQFAGTAYQASPPLSTTCLPYENGIGSTGAQADSYSFTGCDGTNHCNVQLSQILLAQIFVNDYKDWTQPIAFPYTTSTLVDAAPLNPTLYEGTSTLQSTTNGGSCTTGWTQSNEATAGYDC